MKIIKRKSGGVVIFAGDNLQLLDTGATNGDWTDPDTTPANAVLAEVDALPADWIGGAYKHTTDNGFQLVDASLLPKPPAEVVPQQVTRRQARSALLLAGLLDKVQPAIDAIPDPTQRALAQIEWDDSLEFVRNRPILIALGTAIGLDAAGMDQLFIAAEKL